MTTATLFGYPIRVIVLAAAHAFFASIIALPVVVLCGVVFGLTYVMLVGAVPPEIVIFILGLVIVALSVWVGTRLSLIMLGRWSALRAWHGFTAISTLFLVVGNLLDVSLDALGLYRGIPLRELALLIAISAFVFFLVTRRHAS